MMRRTFSQRTSHLWWYGNCNRLMRSQNKCFTSNALLLNESSSSSRSDLTVHPFDLQKQRRDNRDTVQYKRKKKKEYPTLSDDLGLQPINAEITMKYKSAKEISEVGSDMFQLVEKPTHLDIFPKGDPDWMKLTEAILAPVEFELEMRNKALLTLEVDENEFFSREKHPDRSKHRINDWNLLIRAQTAQSYLELVQNTFNKMSLSNNPNILPNVVTYTAVIHACSLLGGKNAHILAFDYFKDMKLKNIEPTIATYGAMIHAFANAGKVIESFEILETMRARDIQPNNVIHSTVLAGCIKSGDLTRAWQHFELMNSKYAIDPDEVSLSIMMNAAARAGQTERAIKLFKQFDSFMLTPTSVTYHTVMFACAKRKEHRFRVFEYADMMELHGHKPSIYTFNILSYAIAKDGKIQKIPQILTKMRAMDVKPDQYTYNTLISAYRVANLTRPPKEHNQNITDALAIYQLMPAEAIPVTIYTLNTTLGVLASALRVNRAVEFFTREYVAHGIKHDNVTYTILITMFVKAKRGEDAEKLFEQFRLNHPEQKPTYAMYKQLIFGLAKSAMDDRATRWLNEMFSIDGYKLNPIDMLQYTTIRSGADNLRRRKREELQDVKQDMEHLLKVF
jgi:pentatricopeptide repeat protein